MLGDWKGAVAVSSARECVLRRERLPGRQQELPGHVCVVSLHQRDSRICALEGKEVAWAGEGLETRNNGVC